MRASSFNAYHIHDHFYPIDFENIILSISISILTNVNSVMIVNKIHIKVKFQSVLWLKVPVWKKDKLSTVVTTVFKGEMVKEH